ncbi:unnamed protein product [Fusarium equiseti]|uniref:Ricin B lectin domain-containing protein n=1 Tax=Fusarium equiseti TaxID=61235 RepID=A0A8J2ISK9_FUSEQ|nr:unnamed protein product [Fusarium equiseti]
MDAEMDAAIEAIKKQKQDYFLPAHWNGKVVYLKNTKSGTCLDLFAEAGRANGTAINGWEPNGSGAQQWKLEKRGDSIWSPWTIQNVASGLYLTLWDTSPHNGTRIVGWERAKEIQGGGLVATLLTDRFNSPGLQEWLILPKGMDTGKCLIQSASTYQYLDLHLGLQENGTPVQGWQREEPMGNQVWMIEDEQFRKAMDDVPSAYETLAMQLLFP